MLVSPNGVWLDARPFPEINCGVTELHAVVPSDLTMRNEELPIGELIEQCLWWHQYHAVCKTIYGENIREYHCKDAPNFPLDEEANQNEVVQEFDNWG